MYAKNTGEATGPHTSAGLCVTTFTKHRRSKRPAHICRPVCYNIHKTQEKQQARTHMQACVLQHSQNTGEATGLCVTTFTKHRRSNRPAHISRPVCYNIHKTQEKQHARTHQQACVSQHSQNTGEATCPHTSPGLCVTTFTKHRRSNMPAHITRPVCYNIHKTQEKQHASTHRQACVLQHSQNSQRPLTVKTGESCSSA
jgi:hypothetical protein